MIFLSAHVLSCEREATANATSPGAAPPAATPTASTPTGALYRWRARSSQPHPEMRADGKTSDLTPLGMEEDLARQAVFNTGHSYPGRHPLQKG
jgi:hypothetical protein